MEGCVSNWVETAVGDYISTAGYPIVLGGQQDGEVGCIDSLFLQSRAERGDEQCPDAGALIPKVALRCLFEGQFAYCLP